MKINRIDERVYHLEDEANCFINLILGDEYALVFDTGIGSKGLLDTIRSLTDLPLLVILSHGHFDHTGGCSQFEKVYLSEEDFNLLDCYPKETLNKWYLEMTGREKSTPFDYSNIYPLDFDSFDLGNLKCQIISLPGHTSGSIGIYIPSLKLLLSGDALLPIQTLNFYNHLSREEMLKTLKRVQKLNFKYYLSSHHENAFDKQIISKLISCIENSFDKKFYDYEYPSPPHEKGVIYIDSLEYDGIGIIISEEEYQRKKGE